jgi:hypothetical protein
MSTSTTRLALQKDLGTENYSVAVVNANLDKIDAAIGATKCTSSTRPGSSLFDGRLIYETDTDALLMYNTTGPAWHYLTMCNVADATARDALTPKHDGLHCYRRDIDRVEAWDGSNWLPTGPLGIVGGKVFTGLNNIGSAITTTETEPGGIYDTGSIGLLPNRRYTIETRYKAKGSVDFDDFTIRIRQGATAGTGGAQIRQHVHNVLHSSFGYTYDIFCDFETGGSAVSKFFTLTAVRTGGTGNLQFIGGEATDTNLVGIWVIDKGRSSRLAVVAT